jgi:hypothetical protein
LKVPGWASGAGRRALVPVALFSASEKQLFEHANRVHPVYFQYPFEKVDDVSIQVPLGWQVSSVPQGVTLDAKAIVYTDTVDNDRGILHLKRVLKSDLVFVDAKNYSTLRMFYERVRSGDEEQIILQPGAAAASN